MFKLFVQSDLDPNAFYHKDPLKAINHFFTSDNAEPPWEFKQTPKGKWECVLELPIGDGASGVLVEAEVVIITGVAYKNILILYLYFESIF